MNESIHDLMMEATRLTQSGLLHEATQTLQRALLGTSAPPETTADPAPEARARHTGARPAQAPRADEDTGRGEHILTGSHAHGGLSRDYRLYVPPQHGGARLPLVVMLHGCTQNPGDFAAGTAMDAWAAHQGGQRFCVLYPAQSQDANPQRCWNWFKHNHQERGRGEPALLASMTRAVVRDHGLDADRVYVAGLSAGGAMAAILGATYPDVFAAAGVHSGLVVGAARNVPQAMGAMRNGSESEGAALRVPTIVFHGDRDQTVHPRNGEQVLASALAEPGTATVEQGTAPQGRRYTVSTHHGADGQVLAEHWLVHDAGHAWSGGQAEGSYTDVRGPDATAQMLRFFWAHPRKASS